MSDDDATKVHALFFTATGAGPDDVSLWLQPVPALTASSTDPTIIAPRTLGLRVGPADDFPLMVARAGGYQMDEATVCSLHERFGRWLDAPRDAARLAAEVVAEDDGVQGRPMPDGAEHHLHAEVRDELVIRIGINTLAHAFLGSRYARDALGENNATIDPREHIKVADLRGFAEDVCAALLDEAEDGSSKLTNVIDAAMQAAIEDGSTNVDIPDDLVSCEECEKVMNADDAHSIDGGYLCDPCHADSVAAFALTRWKCDGGNVLPACEWTGAGPELNVDDDTPLCPTCGGYVEEIEQPATEPDHA